MVKLSFKTLLWWNLKGNLCRDFRSKDSKLLWKNSNLTKNDRRLSTNLQECPWLNSVWGAGDEKPFQNWQRRQTDENQDEKQRHDFVGLWWIWPPVILAVLLSQAPAEPSITVCRHFGVGRRKRRRRLSPLFAAVVPPSQCGRALVSEMRMSPQRGAGRCWSLWREERHHRYNCCCWTSRL